MHALIITFTSHIDSEEVRNVATEFADSVRDVPGLLSKAWLADGATNGGFYLFVDRASADAYAEGPLVAGLLAHPSFSDFSIRHFDVDAELSARTWLLVRDLAQG